MEEGTAYWVLTNFQSVCLIVLLIVMNFRSNVPIPLVCDGYEHCYDGSDEDESMCSACDRNFGYPTLTIDNNKFIKDPLATYACRHRYTAKWICAIPCDQKDGLCLNDEDERFCSLDFTWFLPIYGVFVIAVLGPLLWLTDKHLTFGQDMEECEELNRFDPCSLHVRRGTIREWV